MLSSLNTAFFADLQCRPVLDRIFGCTQAEAVSCPSGCQQVTSQGQLRYGARKQDLSSSSSLSRCLILCSLKRVMS